MQLKFKVTNWPKLRTKFFNFLNLEFTKSFSCLVSPRVAVSGRNFVVDEGGSISINCNYSGIPRPTQIWRRYPRATQVVREGLRVDIRVLLTRNGGIANLTINVRKFYV